VLRRPNFEAPKAHFLFEKNGGGKRLYNPTKLGGGNLNIFNFHPENWG